MIPETDYNVRQNRVPGQKVLYRRDKRDNPGQVKLVPGRYGTTKIFHGTGRDGTTACTVPLCPGTSRYVPVQLCTVPPLHITVHQQILTNGIVRSARLTDKRITDVVFD